MLFRSGLGGLDLFLQQDSTLDPLNLMSGMNTELDDFGLVFTGPGSGYLVSNRNGGRGDDDIYSFNIDLKKVIQLMIPPKRLLTATAKDEKTGAVVPGVRISVSNNLTKNYVTGNDGGVRDSIAWNEVNPRQPEVVVRFEREGYEPKEIRLKEWPDDQQILDLSVSMTPLKEVAMGPGSPSPGGDKKLVGIRDLGGKKFIIYFG